MKIDSSNINLSSTWQFSEKNQVKFEREVKFFDLFDQKLANFDVKVGIDPKEFELTNEWYSTADFDGKNVVELTNQFSNELGKMRQILDAIVERVNSAGMNKCCICGCTFERININPEPPPPVKVFEYRLMEKQTHTHAEQETLDFNANGMVKTMDGRSIDFSFQMDLDRQFFREDQFKYTETGYMLIDPLVINLDSHEPPRLSGAKISFDMDADGTSEEIFAPSKGTGFLSFDKNKDGIINDGTELFGPSTGYGFDELSQYDLDHNFWIDENDEIFDQLTIWENDEQGEMQLTRIKDAGIGAIYLESETTPFDFRDENNELQARLKRSSIALNEDGSVSAVQEMDWTV